MKSISLKYFLKNQLESPCPKFNEFLELPRTEDLEYNYEHITSPFFDKFEKEIDGGVNSIHWKVFTGMEQEKRSGNKEYEMSVVQVLLH